MTKEKLRRYCCVMQRIDLLEDKLLEVETKATSTTRTLKQDLITGGSDGDKMCSQVAHIIQIKDLINTRLAEAYKLRQEIIQAAQNLETNEKRLIELRYLDCKAWNEICIDLKCNQRQVHRLHSKMLKKMH